MKSADKTAKDLQIDLIEALKKGIADPTGKALNDAFVLAVAPAGKVRKGLGKDLYANVVGGDLYSEDRTILGDLYRFFAQALRGNNLKTKPDLLDGPMAREQIRAWNTMKERTTRESQIEYICLVIQIAINFEKHSELKEFCKHIYSKKPKFDTLLKMPFKEKEDLERMIQRQQYLEKCPDPASDPSNIVKTLSEVTQKRLKAFGIDPRQVFSAVGTKSALKADVEIKKLADELYISHAIPSDFLSDSSQESSLGSQESFSSQGSQASQGSQGSQGSHGSQGSQGSQEKEAALKAIKDFTPGYAARKAVHDEASKAKIREKRRDSDHDMVMSVDPRDDVQHPEIMVLAGDTTSGSARVVAAGSISRIV